MSSLTTAAVTGARGMIGRYVVERLLARGWSVRVLSRKTMKYDNAKVKVVTGDLTDEKVIESLFEGVSAVFHCAAELLDESKMYDTNINGAKVLLSVVRNHAEIKYFCHLSSAGVIGPTDRLLVDEKTPCRPCNTYEKTKFEAEQLVLNAGLDVAVCILRPANVFDNKQQGILSLALNHSFQNKIKLLFKGNEGAHLVHALDVAAAAIFFMDKHLIKPEVFFVSYDSDCRNTVLGACGICRPNGNRTSALPSFIPYLVRKVVKGQSLHGDVRFSNDKLFNAGFSFPLGLEKAIKQVCCANEGETR